MNLSRAKELADQHADYICKLLHSHNVDETIIKVVKFHYKTAFINGYKHCLEDLNIFENLPDEPTHIKYYVKAGGTENE